MTAAELPDWTDRLPSSVLDALAAPAHPLNRMFLRLDLVAQRLELTAAERAVVACMLALDVDEDVHDVVMRERIGRAPSRSDVVHLVGGSTADALEALASLERRGVVRAGDEGERPWAAVPVTLAPAVRAECLRRRETDGNAAVPTLLPRVAQALDRVTAAAERTAPRRLHVVIRGRRGSGRDSVLAALLHRLSATPYLRTALQLRGDADSLEPALSGRVSVWDGRATSTHPDDLAHAAAFLARSTTVCVSLLDADDDAPAVPGRVVIAIDADPRDTAERAEGWERALTGRLEPELRTRVAAVLAGRTRAGAGLAHQVASIAAEPAGATPEVWVGALLIELEAALQPSTLRGVSVERPDGAVPSIVVAPAVSDRIAQLLAMMRHAAELATPTRRGVKALFSGPSGTGKTLTARWIAMEVDRPLFRIDLATVVSKWIGETEKNLRGAMHAAEAAGAVLLFDEGDALFGSRGEVSRGSDRYANMEVSYLLQALELFDGLAIVTTNLRGNVDRAFFRRFDVTVEFQPPDPTLRASLWRQELGASIAAVSPHLLRRIATEAELTGGHIAVACRTARALALYDGTSLSDSHLVRAVVTQLRAIGSNVAASRWQVPDD